MGSFMSKAVDRNRKKVGIGKVYNTASSVVCSTMETLETVADTVALGAEYLKQEMVVMLAEQQLENIERLAELGMPVAMIEQSLNIKMDANLAALVNKAQGTEIEVEVEETVVSEPTNNSNKVGNGKVTI